MITLIIQSTTSVRFLPEERFFRFLICFIFSAIFGLKTENSIFWCFDVLFWAFPRSLIQHVGLSRAATHKLFFSAVLLIEIWYAVRWIGWKHLLFIRLFLSTRHGEFVCWKMQYVLMAVSCWKQQTFRHGCEGGGRCRKIIIMRRGRYYAWMPLQRQVDGLFIN